MEQNFFQEIWEKFKRPWEALAFRSYFILYILLLGGCGVFMAIIKECNPTWFNNIEIAQELSSYFIVLSAASIVDLLLATDLKAKSSLVQFSTFAVLFSFILFILAYVLPNWSAYIPAFLGFVLSLFIWVVANSENKKLDDRSLYDEIRMGQTEHENVI